MAEPTSITSRPHIWILNHYAFPPDRGVFTRHYDLAQELIALGNEVTIVAAGFNHYTGREERLGRGQLFRPESIGGIRFVWLRTTPYRGNGLRRAINMVSYLLGVLLFHGRIPRPDVVLGSSVHLLAGVAALFVARRYRVPFYFEVRDLWPQTLIDMGAIRAGGFTARALGWLELYLFRRATRIISVLPGAVQYIGSLGIPRDRVVYIPNGVALHRVAETSSGDAGHLQDTIRAARAAGSFVAIYAGAHGAVNRLDVILRGARLLADRGEPRIRIILVGDGPEKTALLRLARELDVRNVSFHEPVSKSVIPQVLEMVDCGIVPLPHLGVYRFGLSQNKLFDYFAARRPVILAGALADDPVAEARAGITVPPEDPTALADGLVDLASRSPAELEALGHNGYDYVRKRHDVRLLGRRLAETLGVRVGAGGVHATVDAFAEP